MTRTIYDYLVLAPEPYNEKYGQLGDSLTEKQQQALQLIADNPETLAMTVPEFLEEEQYMEASRHWLRKLLYRFPAGWFTDDAEPHMDDAVYEEWFESGEHGKKYPWSDNGYVCEVDECGFEAHWGVEAKRHEDANESTSYGKPEHQTRNTDLDAIESSGSSGGSGGRGKWQTATVKELLLEHSKPYRDRWGSPRINEEVTWALKDVPRLQEMGHDVSYDMTVSEFLEVFEAINDERRRRDEEDDDFELNADDDSILYDAFTGMSEQYARKMLLRKGPGITSRSFTSDEPAEAFEGESRTLQFTDGWEWVCDCGETFDDRASIDQHIDEEREGLEMGDDGWWDHQATLEEVNN